MAHFVGVGVFPGFVGYMRWELMYGVDFSQGNLYI